MLATATRTQNPITKPVGPSPGKSPARAPGRRKGLRRRRPIGPVPPLGPMVAGPHSAAQSAAFTMTAFSPPQGSAGPGPDEQGVAITSPLRRAADASGGGTASASTIQFSQANADASVAPPALSLNQTTGAGRSTYTPKETYSTVGSGAALPVAVRNPLARSFGADLSPIRVHQDPQAQAMAKGLSTRAFTVSNNVYLGSGERPDDLGLMAHETAHALQQRGAPAAMQTFTSGRGDACEAEAQQASSAVLRGESFTVQQTTTSRPQGLLGIDIPDPLDWLANKANIIPGFRMLTIILGVNPINMSGVDRSAANILRAMIEFMPGGGLITQALDNAGIFEKAGAFVETQLASLGLVGSSIKAAVTAFIGGLSLRRIITDPGGVWESAKSIFTEPIDRIKAFAVGLVVGIVQLIKDAILKPIARMAEGTEGYNLLKGILGKDPITGETVARSAETLLGPLLKMIGLGDVWQKMQDAKAVPRCWAWFQSTMGQLLAIVSSIPSEFLAAFKSLTLEDIILVPKAFIKLGKVFVGFMGKFVSWGVNAMWELLKIVFDVVSPGAWGYIQQTGGALQSILKNPLPFVGNLVKAAKAGFQNFSGRFLTHLKNGLIDWLTGSLSGIYIPKALTLLEFGKMAISVLGLSWTQIRGKLVKALGPQGEKIMQGLEGAFDVIKALVTGGPSAAWEVLKDKLTSLKDTIVSGITKMVVEAVVTKAIPKFIAMFIPGAGFISAIISIYDIVMVFVEKISKIIQVVNAFVSSIVAIAAGNIGAAASKVESVLAGLLTLAINFLAGFAGLGKIASKVRGIVDKVRDTVDKALDAAIAFIINKAKALFARFFGTKEKPDAPADPNARLSMAMDEADKLISQMAKKDGLHLSQVPPKLAQIKAKYTLKALEVRATAAGLVIVGDLNPHKEKNKELRKLKVTASLPAARLVMNPADISLERAVADVIDAAQETMNDLYRAGGSLGDKSTAFAIMAEQARGGPGNAPKPFFFKNAKVKKRVKNEDGTPAVNAAGQPIYEKDPKGKVLYEVDASGNIKRELREVLHFDKVEGYLTALGRKITTITGLASRRPDILAEVKARLQQEMKKLTEAQEWAQQYRAGANPKVPKWAKPYEGQLHGPDIIEDEE